MSCLGLLCCLSLWALSRGNGEATLPLSYVLRDGLKMCYLITIVQLDENEEEHHCTKDTLFVLYLRADGQVTRVALVVEIQNMHCCHRII